MKLGEGGEAFFVFETSAAIPVELQTSPLSSPTSSPESKPIEAPPSSNLDEPEPLDLDSASTMRRGRQSMSIPLTDALRAGLPYSRPKSGDWSGVHLERSHTDDALPSGNAILSHALDANEDGPLQVSKAAHNHVGRGKLSPGHSSQGLRRYNDLRLRPSNKRLRQLRELATLVPSRCP